MLLAEMAVNEQDPQELLVLVTEMNELLEQDQRRLGMINNTEQKGQDLHWESGLPKKA